MKKLMLGVVGVLAFAMMRPPVVADIPDRYTTIYRVETTTEYGSAVAYKAVKRTDGKYDLYLLTAKHATREITEANPGFVVSLSTPILSTNVAIKKYKIAKISTHPTLDISVITVVAELRLAVVEFDIVLPHRLEKVFAIGCSIGYGPHLTEGRITWYDANTGNWITNADTAFGSSGGGVFKSDTGKLLGITSSLVAISTKLGDPIPIDHIHLFIPLYKFVRWMHKENLL